MFECPIFILHCSPDNCKLACIEDVISHLLTAGTCKCGLRCPLDVYKVFDFDPNKIPLPDHDENIEPKHKHCTSGRQSHPQNLKANSQTSTPKKSFPKANTVSPNSTKRTPTKLARVERRLSFSLLPQVTLGKKIKVVSRPLAVKKFPRKKDIIFKMKSSSSCEITGQSSNEEISKTKKLLSLLKNANLTINAVAKNSLKNSSPDTSDSPTPGKSSDNENTCLSLENSKFSSGYFHVQEILKQAKESLFKEHDSMEADSSLPTMVQSTEKEASGNLQEMAKKTSNNKLLLLGNGQRTPVLNSQGNKETFVSKVSLVQSLPNLTSILSGDVDNSNANVELFLSDGSCGVDKKSSSQINVESCGQVDHASTDQISRESTDQVNRKSIDQISDDQIDTTLSQSNQELLIEQASIDGSDQLSSFQVSTDHVNQSSLDHDDLKHVDIDTKQSSDDSVPMDIDIDKLPTLPSQVTPPSQLTLPSLPTPASPLTPPLLMSPVSPVLLMSPISPASQFIHIVSPPPSQITPSPPFSQTSQPPQSLPITPPSQTPQSPPIIPPSPPPQITPSPPPSQITPPSIPIQDNDTSLDSDLLKQFILDFSSNNNVDQLLNSDPMNSDSVSDLTTKSTANTKRKSRKKLGNKKRKIPVTATHRSLSKSKICFETTKYQSDDSLSQSESPEPDIQPSVSKVTQNQNKTLNLENDCSKSVEGSNSPSPVPAVNDVNSIESTPTVTEYKPGVDDWKSAENQDDIAKKETAAENYSELVCKNEERVENNISLSNNVEEKENLEKTDLKLDSVLLNNDNEKPLDMELKLNLENDHSELNNIPDDNSVPQQSDRNGGKKLPNCENYNEILENNTKIFDSAKINILTKSATFTTQETITTATEQLDLIPTQEQNGQQECMEVDQDNDPKQLKTEPSEQPDTLLSHPPSMQLDGSQPNVSFTKISKDSLYQPEHTNALSDNQNMESTLTIIEPESTDKPPMCTTSEDSNPPIMNDSTALALPNSPQPSFKLSSNSVDQQDNNIDSLERNASAATGSVNLENTVPTNCGEMSSVPTTLKTSSSDSNSPANLEGISSISAEVDDTHINTPSEDTSRSMECTNTNQDSDTSPGEDKTKANLKNGLASDTISTDTAPVLDNNQTKSSSLATDTSNEQRIENELLEWQPAVKAYHTRSKTRRNLGRPMYTNLLTVGLGKRSRSQSVVSERKSPVSKEKSLMSETESMCDSVFEERVTRKTKRQKTR